MEKTLPGIFVPYFILALMGCVLAGDIFDSVREPVVRPNQELLKRWMYNKKLVLEKGWVWDRTELIEPAKLKSIKAQGGSVVQKPPPLANYATSVWTFNYADGNSKINNYTVIVTYAWSIGITGIERKLNNMIITGP